MSDETGGSPLVPTAFGERLTLDELSRWVKDDNVVLSKAAKEVIEELTVQADVKVKLLLLGVLKQKVGHIASLWEKMTTVRDKLFSEKTIENAETHELVQIYRALRDDLRLTEESMQQNAVEASKVTIAQLHLVFDTGNKGEISKLPTKSRERLRKIFALAVEEEVASLETEEGTVLDADFEVKDEDDDAARDAE